MSGRRSVRMAVVAAALSAVSFAAAVPARAQETVPAVRASRPLTPTEVLGRRFQAARERALVESLLGRFGAMRPVLPPVRVPLADSAMEAKMRAMDYQEIPVVVEPLPPPFSVATAVKTPRFGLPGFQATFGEVPWSFLGNTFTASGDTIRTTRLRGALQARYGAPTRTLGDLGPDARLGSATAFQFEYWFAVNDTIPLLVSDVGGPRDRGLVVATHARLREWLPVLRAWLLDDLAAARPEPWADYYYDPPARAWSVVGFDGFRIVERAIPRPDVRVAPRPIPSDLRR